MGEGIKLNSLHLNTESEEYNRKTQTEIIVCFITESEVKRLSLKTVSTTRSCRS